MGTTPGKAARPPAHEREAQRYPGLLRWLLAQWWGLLALVLLGLHTTGHRDQDAAGDAGMRRCFPSSSPRLCDIRA